MIGESSVFVQALVENVALQKAFLELVAAPQQRRHLDKLIDYVSTLVCNAALVYYFRERENVCV